MCASGRCDTQGRVMGGLGAVPGFGWWPIKAYRPCSALNEAGIEYTRWVSMLFAWCDSHRLDGS